MLNHTRLTRFVQNNQLTVFGNFFIKSSQLTKH